MGQVVGGPMIFTAVLVLKSWGEFSSGSLRNDCQYLLVHGA